MNIGGSRRALVRDKIEAQDMQKRWFTLMAAITRQMGGKIRITKQVLKQVPLDAELEVNQDQMTGDLIVRLVGFNAGQNGASADGPGDDV